MCHEILSLTKLNWNNADFCDQLPITITAAARAHDMTVEGLIVVMNEGYFLDKPGTYPKNAIPIIMSENVWDGHPPFKFVLNTSKGIKPGNFNITFVFTYCDKQDYYTDYRTIEIHINNWIERNQKIIQITASILAVMALGSTLIQTVYTVLQYYARADQISGKIECFSVLRRFQGYS